MKGIEISREYFYKEALPVLKRDFSDTLKYLAFGLVGSGSECYGFDDEISKDHDFELGFCIFVPSEEVIDRRTLFLLERMYAKLPKEFMGLKKGMVSPVGGNRHGVIGIDDFYRDKVGNGRGELSLRDWIRIPLSYLCEGTNGEVFEDYYGEFTGIRNNLLTMPEDAKIKRISGHVLNMAQTGLYNYERIIKHGEEVAAQFAINEFVDSLIEVIFLLNNKYYPYYKWKIRALKNLNLDYNYEEDLKRIMFLENIKENVVIKRETIFKLCEKVGDEIRTKYNIDSKFEDIPFVLNDKIIDPDIRNLNILFGVGK